MLLKVLNVALQISVIVLELVGVPEHVRLQTHQVLACLVFRQLEHLVDVLQVSLVDGPLLDLGFC